ncbi:MAG TPA: hypothetical protein DCX89_02060 [Saprospirales bacterium]|nr:hypothetical protein [Saprospirales bacterium]
MFIRIRQNSIFINFLIMNPKSNQRIPKIINMIDNFCLLSIRPPKLLLNTIIFQEIMKRQK